MHDNKTEQKIKEKTPRSGRLIFMADGEVCLDKQKIKSKKSCELRFFKIFLIVYLRIPSACRPVGHS